MEFITDIAHPIQIFANGVGLDGLLHVPHGIAGMVLFAHGSGSGRLSPRNQHVADLLHHARFGTLLFDLLTPEEDAIDVKTMEYRFDIELLATRLVAATEWIHSHTLLRNLPIGYYGASTGGGAALMAAAQESKLIQAVVSRGGRPDLAIPVLAEVKAPTLFIVGGEDKEVIKLNEKAYDLLKCEKKIKIIPGATHLFEEPGKLDEVAKAAVQWFKEYLVK